MEEDIDSKEEDWEGLAFVVEIQGVERLAGLEMEQRCVGDRDEVGKMA